MGRNAVGIARARAFPREGVERVLRRGIAFAQFLGIIVPSSSRLKVRPSRKRIVSSSASGASRNSRAISPASFRWRSALASSSAPGIVDCHAFANAGDDIGERAPLGNMHETSLVASSGIFIARAKAARVGQIAAHMSAVGHRGGQATGAARRLRANGKGRLFAHFRGRSAYPPPSRRSAGLAHESRRSSIVRWHCPLGARRLPCGQKPAEPAISGAILGIGENVGRSVGKDQPRSRDDAHRADRCGFLTRENMGAHHAGERIAVGDAKPGQSKRAACATSSSGCEAPRRNEKFVIVASSAKRGSARIISASPHPNPLPRAGEGALSSPARGRRCHA